jgi:hypothetical protein
MTTLRRFRALPRPVTTSDAGRLVAKMRDRAGHDATILAVRSKPQADRRKPRP